ncbi:MAG: MBL fold metallo-hydrolase [Bradymonadaceae bacterium]
MSDIEEIGDGIVRAGLARPEAWPESVSAPKNVYIVDGDHPALINAGHPAQFEELVDVLAAVGLDPSDVSRVVSTSWAIDVAGGAIHLPEAQHFLASPDMRQPRAYREQIERPRDELRELGKRVREQKTVPEGAERQLEAFIDDYYPEVPSELDFIPIRGGHEVRASRLTLEVLESPGPSPGHVCLYESEGARLFSGDVATSGLPETLDDVRSYVVSLERLVDVEADQLLPNRGAARHRPTWTLQCSLRFVDNYVSNAPAALFEEPTLLEFAKRDMGYWPDDFAEAVLQLRQYRLLMDELVRAGMIDAEGEGFERRYGTDVDDPREPLRRAGD